MNQAQSKRIVFAAGPKMERGGSAEYAREIGRMLSERGYSVTAVHFSLFKARIPGLRHVSYLLKLLTPALRSRAIIAIDTWSVGIPAFLASKVTGCPLIIRVGGDFLWEHHVRRTGNEVRLSEFYTSPDVRLSLKERFIFAGTRFLLLHADCIAFNTEWQKNIWQQAYGLRNNVRVIENRYPPHPSVSAQRTNVFVSAGRASSLKNTERIQASFSEAQTRHPKFSLDTRLLPEAEHEERLRTCYALIQGSFSDIAPNAVIKASAFGTPFICTDDTGIRGRLEGRGLFIHTLDQQALVEAIESLMDPEIYARFAEAAAAPGYQRDWNQVTDDFESALRHVGASR